MEHRGRGSEDKTIDRIDNDKGYFIGNIQVLTKHDNSSKYWKTDWGGYEPLTEAAF